MAQRQFRRYVVDSGTFTGGTPTTVNFNAQLQGAPKGYVLAGAMVYARATITNDDAGAETPANLETANPRILNYVEWSSPRTASCGNSRVRGDRLSDIANQLGWQGVGQNGKPSAYSQGTFWSPVWGSITGGGGTVERVLGWVIPAAAPIRGRYSADTALAIEDAWQTLTLEWISDADLQTLFSLTNASASGTYKVIAILQKVAPGIQVGRPLIVAEETGIAKSPNSQPAAGNVVAYVDFDTPQVSDVEASVGVDGCFSQMMDINAFYLDQPSGRAWGPTFIPLLNADPDTGTVEGFPALTAAPDLSAAQLPGILTVNFSGTTPTYTMVRAYIPLENSPKTQATNRAETLARLGGAGEVTAVTASAPPQAADPQLPQQVSYQAVTGNLAATLAANAAKTQGES